MLILVVGGATFAAVPSFDQDFAKYLTSSTPDSQGRVETVFSLCIDKDLSLMENVKNLFYPSTSASLTSPCGGQPGGQLWGVVQTLGIVIIFVFLVLAGVKFIMEAKSGDGPKKAASSLFYIAYGAFLIFGVIWILGTVLNLPNVQGTTQLVNAVQNGLFLQILSFFKVLAFFLAIIMMVIAGIKMMSSMDKADKIKSARTGVLNIIIALVFIKLIDYIFYIAQVPTFAVQAKELIINVAIVLGYISGAAFVAAIFYAGFLFMTAGGSEDSIKKARAAITNIVIASVVIFMFLLIVFQIFNEFA
jgi:hypothetical protein